MKPAIKRKWVKALRSGAYRQAIGGLQDYAGFCCLGVLRHCVDPKDKRSLGNEGGYLDGFQLVEFGLTSEIQEALAGHLNDCAGHHVGLPDGNVCLDAPVPFEMIAGLIDHAL